MYSPLIVDRTEPKWLLLEQILGCISSRRARQELSKREITPIPVAVTALKILFLSMFFSVDIAYTVKEIRSRRKLRRFLGISEVPTAAYLYRFLSRFEEEKLVSRSPLS